MRPRLPLIFLSFLAVVSAAAQVVPGRFLVELDGEPGVRRGRDAVRREQNAVRVWLRMEGALERLSVETVANAIAVEADEAGAERLRRIPGVKRVQPVIEYRMTLDAALPLLGAPAAWELAGGNPGAGVKIGIIDSGIESTHPGFQDASMTAPEGYPKIADERDREFTSGKVIVARSYADLLPRREADLSARDRVGHGTAAAMAAAGVVHDGPFGPISGVAPKAWLGSYKVFGSTGGTTSDVVLKAIDDAVLDGMDIINLSLGSAPAPLLEADIELAAIDRARERGVMVVVSAGNEGPDLTTISSPATAPSALAVGASFNGRTLGSPLEVEGADAVLTQPGDGADPPDRVAGPLTDVTAVAGSGLGCEAFPADSLQGRIALIERGSCTFALKIGNAQRAGAVAVVVYGSELGPDLLTMATGGVSLPASMIHRRDGLALKAYLAGHEGPAGAVLHFTLGPVPQNASLLAEFTGKGPGPDRAIKPEVVAAGTDIVTAGEREVPGGSLYAASGYVIVNGTSFSAPLTAGAAAVLRAARPGLTVAQYRSLLIGNAADLGMPVMEAGAGAVRLDRAMTASIAVAPEMLGLGAGGSTVEREEKLRVTNLGVDSAEFRVAFNARREGLSITLPETIAIGAGETAEVALSIRGVDLAPGAYDGAITLTNISTEAVTRVPYWYGVSDNTPAGVALISLTSTGRSSAQVRDAVVFRIIDAAGLPVDGPSPEVDMIAGGGAVLRVTPYGSVYPGVFALSVILGPDPGSNVFRLRAGEIRRDITITGQ